jgi:DNA-repair protein complementing XP-A cells
MMDTIMELTPEQLERIQKNQKRALEIRLKKQGMCPNHSKENRNEEGKVTQSSEKQEEKSNGDEDDLEDFEIGASAYITKEQASKLYCLPVESIELCSDVMMKENPKCSKFAAMKLYSRKEIRKRARERFGGLEALRSERIRRQQKRLKKDMDATLHVFESSNKSNFG